MSHFDQTGADGWGAPPPPPPLTDDQARTAELHEQLQAEQGYVHPDQTDQVGRVDEGDGPSLQRRDELDADGKPVVHPDYEPPRDDDDQEPAVDEWGRRFAPGVQH